MEQVKEKVNRPERSPARSRGPSSNRYVEFREELEDIQKLMITKNHKILL